MRVPFQKPTSEKGIWKNLGLRFFSAVILIAICFSPFFFGGMLWAILVMVLGCRLIWEWVTMADKPPSWAAFAVPMIGLIVGVIYIYLGAVWAACVTTAITTAFVTVERSRRGGGLWSGFGFLYVAVPCMFIVALRGNEVGFKAPGLLLLAYLIAVVAAADTGAYFGGSYFKGPKIAPRLSPKKTWSGFLSGFIFASIVGGVLAWILRFSPSHGVLLAMPVIIFSVIGDFLESGLKRKLEVKDSGDLLPGHGGLMDRLDSLMMVVFAVSIALYIFPGLWPL